MPCLFGLAGRSSGEPTIGITPDGKVYYYAVNPTHPPLLGFGSFDEYQLALTQNQGTSWDFIVPAIAGLGAHPNSNDAYLYVDPGTGRIFLDDLQPPYNCSLLAWSDDGGTSWNHSVSGCMETDHQNVFTGKPVLGPTDGYPNVVYRCAANGGALDAASTATTCQRSRNGGLTWLPPGTPAFTIDPTKVGHQGVQGWCDGLPGHGVVAENGVVYLPKGLCGEPWLATSHDEGLTWTRTRVSDKGMSTGWTGTQSHDGTVAIDSVGTVYYAWIALDRLPYVAVSRDGGRTFEKPLAMSPPGLNEASMPAFAAGGPGRIVLAYYGSTTSPGNFTTPPTCLKDPLACGTSPTKGDYSRTTWNGYVTVGFDVDEASPTFWTASLNDPADPLVRGECPASRCQEVLDFIDLRIAPDGSPWVALVDDCRGDCMSGAKDAPWAGAVVGHLVGIDLR